MTYFSLMFVKALLVSQLYHDPSIDPRELLCLSEAIYYEAGSEHPMGKIAVGNVIINRTNSNVFPNTICSVVSQPKQFSYRDTKRYLSGKVHKDEYDEIFDSVTIAYSMLKYGMDDLTNGSKYYLNQSISKNQSWTRRLQQTVKIGQHTFFKRIDTIAKNN